MTIQPIGAQVDAGANTGAASALGGVSLVLAVNTSSSNQLVSIEDGTTGTLKASFTLLANTDKIFKKGGSDEVFAAATTVKFTPLGYAN